MKKIYNKFKHSIVKNKFYNVLTPILIVIFLVSGYKLISHKSPVNKAELAYLDHSPAGANGGSVMPASCDSYPAHSTCECTSGAVTNVACPVSSGSGSQTKTCIVSGDNLVWSSTGACNIISCDPGFDLVTDNYSGSISTYCKANCTGNEYRTYTSTSRRVRTGCAEWDENKRRVCIDPIYSWVTDTVASCSACPGSTIPNANHTSCSAPATPSVNINLGN